MPTLVKQLLIIKQYHEIIASLLIVIIMIMIIYILYVLCIYGYYEFWKYLYPIHTFSMGIQILIFFSS